MLCAFDQFGPLSIRPCHGACWARRKKPARLRATYHRTHGIRYFHGCYGIGDDQLWGVVREHKGADHTLAALKSIRAARPGGYRLFVIPDNDRTPAVADHVGAAGAAFHYVLGLPELTRRVARLGLPALVRSRRVVIGDALIGIGCRRQWASSTVCHTRGKHRIYRGGG